MYGGRFPDYALHSMHTQLQEMAILRHPYVWHSQKTRQLFFSYPSSSDNSASTASS